MGFEWLHNNFSGLRGIKVASWNFREFQRGVLLGSSGSLGQFRRFQVRWKDIRGISSGSQWSSQRVSRSLMMVQEFSGQF